MIEFRRYSAIVTLIVAALLAACGPGSTPPAGTPAVPPSSTPPSVVATPAIPLAVSRSIQLDPATVEDADSLAVSNLVYDGLVRLDGNGNVQPALAVGWTVSDDQLDYILELRQGVTFTGGTPFNADVVLANFNRWFDPADPLRGGREYPGWSRFFLGFKGDVDSQGVAISPFDGIEKVDEQTVLVHLNRPQPDFLQNLAQPPFAILDPALLAAQGDAVGTTLEGVSGTGAYALSVWSDSGLVLAPNARYWGALPAGEIQIAWK